MQKIYGVYDSVGETCVMCFFAVSDEDAMRQLRLSFAIKRPQSVDGMGLVQLGDVCNRRTIATVESLCLAPEREAELHDAEQKGYGRGWAESEKRLTSVLDSLKALSPSKRSMFRVFGRK